MWVFRTSCDGVALKGLISDGTSLTPTDIMSKERALRTKTTKGAAESKRIATEKVAMR